MTETEPHLIETPNSRHINHMSDDSMVETFTYIHFSQYTKLSTVINSLFTIK